MGLFDFFKKKEQPKEDMRSNILLAMPLFINGDRYELNSVIKNLENYWNLNVAAVKGDNESAVMTINEETVALVFISAPIPANDIESTAQYSYNWITALDDLKDCSGHAIVSIISENEPAIDRFKLLSKILHSILTTSNSVGIYQGNQSLLIPKQQYVDSAETLKNDNTPIHLWVYIGLRNHDGRNSAYTYGLSEFGKHEMEILNSQLDLGELHHIVSNICAYIISSNVTFKEGETLGFTTDQKIKITLSEGHFVDGQSFKLEM